MPRLKHWRGAQSTPPSTPTPAAAGAAPAQAQDSVVRLCPPRRCPSQEELTKTTPKSETRKNPTHAGPISRPPVCYPIITGPDSVTGTKWGGPDGLQSGEGGREGAGEHLWRKDQELTAREAVGVATAPEKWWVWGARARSEAEAGWGEAVRATPSTRAPRMRIGTQFSRPRLPLITLLSMDSVAGAAASHGGAWPPSPY